MSKFYLILLIAIATSKGEEDKKNVARKTRGSWGESSAGGKGGAATSYVYSNIGTSSKHGSDKGHSRSFTGFSQGGSGGEGIKSWDSYGMKVGSDRKFRADSSGGHSSKTFGFGGGSDISSGSHHENGGSGVEHSLESLGFDLSSFEKSGSGGHGFDYGGQDEGYGFGFHSAGQDFGGSGHGFGAGGEHGMASLGHSDISGGLGYGMTSKLIDVKDFKDTSAGEDSFGRTSSKDSDLLAKFGHFIGGGMDSSHGAGSYFGQGLMMGRRPYFLQHHQPEVHETTKAIPYYQELKIPVPHPVRQQFVIPLPIKVPEPFLIKIPVPVTIEKTVQVPVEKQIPYEVEKPVPVKVVKKVRVPVPKPVPIPVPVYKTKYVHHTKRIYDGHKDH